MFSYVAYLQIGRIKWSVYMHLMIILGVEKTFLSKQIVLRSKTHLVLRNLMKIGPINIKEKVWVPSLFITNFQNYVI